MQDALKHQHRMGWGLRVNALKLALPAVATGIALGFAMSSGTTWPWHPYPVASWSLFAACFGYLIMDLRRYL